VRNVVYESQRQGKSDEMDQMFKAEDEPGAEDVWTGNWMWVFGECECVRAGRVGVFVL
jgi:hypothetical protein